MDQSEIKEIAEAELAAALGAGWIRDVSVTAKHEDDGTEYLDIIVNNAADRELPKAAISLAASTRLRRRLAELGETRFPSIIFVSTADAA